MTEVERMIENAQAAMAEEVFEEVLRAQADVDPTDLPALLDLLALGLTNGSWRNSCVEEWHAEGRLSDGDMMRINSHTTFGIRQRLRGWCKELDITSGSSESLAKVTLEDVNVLTHRLFRWLTNPERRLPTGMTLGELASIREDLAEYEDHAEGALGAFEGQMERRGVRHGLLYTAGHGALACSQWWAHPRWPGRVDLYISVLDNPANRHWGTDGERLQRLGPEPTAVKDRAALRRTLLDTPWKLDAEAAQWITNSGIGYLMPVT
ncbi:hypothetical protein AB0D29_22645 [Streptomyces sp. NPDC048424]|uniref:hypothetical protein n=1 Tax=Streptomyces sp. NPDC048424 TaxID=3155265 RepID=UPI003443A357